MRAIFGDLLFQQMLGLREMIERGYIVAATDYPGLGTTGPHPYLVGVSEARAVIDFVRAARSIENNDAGNRFTVGGYSQGGQAAVFTGMIAKTYAPELDLLGVAAAAPATNLITLKSQDVMPGLDPRMTRCMSCRIMKRNS